MAWNYSGDPSASDLDWVRFRIGDTLPDDPQLTDAEINALLTQYGGTLSAAYEAAKRLAALYSRRVDTSVGDSRSESLSQRQAAYKALADELEREVAIFGGGGSGGGGGGIRATGLSLTRRATVRADTDRVQPPARRGQWSRDDDSSS